MSHRCIERVAIRDSCQIKSRSTVVPIRPLETPWIITLIAATCRYNFKCRITFTDTSIFGGCDGWYGQKLKNCCIRWQEQATFERDEVELGGADLILQCSVHLDWLASIILMNMLGFHVFYLGFISNFIKIKARVDKKKTLFCKTVKNK